MTRFSSQVPCDCQVCKSGSRTARYAYNKYGQPHHGACMCERCLRSYFGHNDRRTCECDDCRTHRHHLYKQGEKARKARSAATPRQGRNVRVATINLCGRKGCNAMMTSDAAGVIQLWKRPDDDDSRAFELCPGCVADVVNLLESGRIGDREQAYKEPYQEPKSDAAGDPLGGVATADLERAFYARKALESGGVSQNLQAHLEDE